MPAYLQVFTTVPTRAAARRIGRELVRARLAACVQVVGPIQSTYWWQGSIEQTGEWLCLVKTTRARYNSLVRRLGELHPYDTPEILALPVAAGGKRYLRWLTLETRPPPTKRSKARR